MAKAIIEIELIKEIIGHFTNIRLLAELVSASITAVLSFDFYTQLQSGKTVIESLGIINLKNVFFAMIFSLVFILIFTIFFSIVVALIEVIVYFFKSKKK